MLGKTLILVNINDREWNLNQLLFADDTVLVGDSETLGKGVWEDM